MRTPASRLWLLSALIAVASGTGNLSFVASSFTGGFSFSYNGAFVQTSIFDARSVDPRTFSWTSDTPITIRNVCLGNDQSHQIIAEEDALSEDGTGSSKMTRDIILEDSKIELNLSTSNYSGSITIDQIGLEELSANFSHLPLVFQIQWAEVVDETADNSVDYYSYSQVWGLAEDISEATNMYGLNFDFDSSATVIAQGTSALMSVSSQTPTAASTITTSPSPTTSSDEPASKSNSSKYGLLSKGALIGTVVGGVASLVLTLIVVFLCMRRHRRNTRNQQDHDRDAQDLMAEKQARAAGAAPDTPYSVDSSQPLNLGRGLSGLHENTANMPRSLVAGEGSQRSSAVYSSLRNVTSVGTGLGNGSGSEHSPTVTHPSSSISLHEPYADLVQDQFERSTSRATAERMNSNIDTETEQTPLSPGSIRDEPRPRASGSSRTGTPQLGPTRLVRSDTPGGISISDYLHEDGMTEDEIKRLEEEERALDEAIEQARTDSRAARGR
ncbi:hypothetical protein N0V93_001339 [Gnomoniopsis smithogilvyi]|uniref:Mid2 domain-containing protein n=1 Tax=Gnomoniopsis smithogilvyi TaxID=1191159 RepID=A0A9W9D2I8_9PEZI|nr:hypothetical protein N0V93_001339 [Gnomoniopsis smithogilvyi]